MAHEVSQETALKKKRRMGFTQGLKIAWGHILVFFGYRIWVKPQWNRPKFALCVFHGLQMKRGRKTEVGAFYYCPKCKRSYHLESKGNKLVPV